LRSGRRLHLINVEEPPSYGGVSRLRRLWPWGVCDRFVGCLSVPRHGCYRCRDVTAVKRGSKYGGVYATDRVRNGAQKSALNDGFGAVEDLPQSCPLGNGASHSTPTFAVQNFHDQVQINTGQERQRKA
jgi:hypothetical protein